MRIDYQKLAEIAVNPQARNTPAKDTIDVLSSYLQLISNLIFAHESLTEGEMAMIIQSMDRWVKNKAAPSNRTYSVGTIVQLDWGLNYGPELSYKHPAVIIEEWSTMILVVPATSNASAVANAYHPVDHSDGSWFYRKVGPAEGFSHTCALILNNAKIVSKNRVLSVSGQISGDISKPENVFREIRSTMMQHLFAKEWIEHQKTVQAYNEEKAKYAALQEDYDRLLAEYTALKSSFQDAHQGA